VHAVIEPLWLPIILIDHNREVIGKARSLNTELAQGLFYDRTFLFSVTLPVSLVNVSLYKLCPLQQNAHAISIVTAKASAVPFKF
jgi:hypothetical protein